MKRIMKRKRIGFFAMALTATVLFSACGNKSAVTTSAMAGSSNSSNTITVSEMLDTVLADSDNGRITIYRYDVKESTSKVMGLHVYEYDGTALYEDENANNFTIEDIVAKKVDVKMNEEGYEAELKLNNETFAGEYIASRKGIGFYNTFSHIEIAGISFMCFSYTDPTTYEDSACTYYTLIPDTKNTKNKTVVYDSDL